MNAPVTLEAGSWRVCFFWRHDRYAHRIEQFKFATGTWQPMLESVEGTPDVSWPPSPPLTALHVETRPANCRVALLVGQAGTSHWSAAVAADADRAVLEFDIACRASMRATFQGSTYHAHAARVAQLLQPHFNVGDGSGAAWSLDGDRTALIIQPVLTDASGPATSRWQYTLARHHAAARA